ncbi:MCE family protein [Saccharopolyspora hirsuta]|uniref:MCE family protein n=1 Tax=Saccharopolyspora hirsuta TaxID=1837 RepID=A0A5M7BCJ9_SACHI|nr:MCE family protein [Saccharopolyspora hirsuta]KAA5827139.1 MCE family protein [Saccharopolyspora hirsuta]
MRGRKWWIAIAVAALLAGAGWFALAGSGGKRITAHFTSAVGIYPQSDVRVLGVTVGTVDSVVPRGDHVAVTMTVDADVPVPAEATALIVTPSVVADRYVQLASVRTGGPELPDGAQIPVSRTATPVELDQLFTSLDQLTTALGPEGANADGAVSELLRQSARTLAGNGAPLGESIRQLGDLARTLNDSKGDLFTTVDELSAFTAVLAANDEQAGHALEQLSSITEVLAADRDDLGAALAELDDAVTAVRDFIRDNRGRIHSNVDKLAAISRILADQKQSVAEALDTAPNALTNVVEAYNPRTGLIEARGNLLEFAAQGPVLPLPSAGGQR